MNLSNNRMPVFYRGEIRTDCLFLQQLSWRSSCHNDVFIETFGKEEFFGQPCQKQTSTLCLMAQAVLQINAIINPKIYFFLLNWILKDSSQHPEALNKDIRLVSIVCTTAIPRVAWESLAICWKRADVHPEKNLQECQEIMESVQKATLGMLITFNQRDISRRS